MGSSYIEIDSYSSVFLNPMSGTKTVVGDYEGYSNVVKITSSTNLSANWYNHSGYFYLDAFAPLFLDGYFVFDVFVSNEVAEFGFVIYNGSNVLEEINLKKGSFDSSRVKVVDTKYQETKFAYNAWNRVVIDLTDVPRTPDIIFSFSNDCAVDGQQEAYLTNFAYMSVENYQILSNK